MRLASTCSKQGGNAVDAAVATGFALAVTLPRAGNIGGGGFMLIHLAETDEQVFIDYRETAPAAATRDMFLKEDGSVDQAKAYFSHQAAGVPGTVAGLIHAQERYGKLSLKEVIQPAIDLAKKGFDTPLALHMSLSARAERLAKNEEAKRIYLQGGDAAPSPGTLFQQADLARTLTRIRDKGADGFYTGETAALIAGDMAANDGLITTRGSRQLPRAGAPASAGAPSATSRLSRRHRPRLAAFIFCRCSISSSPTRWSPMATTVPPTCTG